ncbi:putative polyketide synthase [Streptomyces sp. NBRC 110611]|uniref:beta-ketoacyl [acyl carrier protein] synthase domain-containing protein n=1 Tax=Streptomyces sp. NBRC 110611 TaxID=1621259 RepID=UPI00082FBED5|nr:polyketide synthase [Streptomyces sp. NBRC 110611]GAU70359.1 putative polyketide synthase [Streptomyces sp. NBRC 110611]
MSRTERTPPDERAVAVIGLAFELPGCSDWAALLDLLRTGRTAVRPFPPRRAARTGATPSPDHQEGGWIDDITGFDHRHFGLSPAEARRIDPRHRRLLQLAVHTIEHAGYSPGELRGRNAAVLVAASGGPDPVLGPPPGPDGRPLIGPELAGSSPAFAPGRIAYLLDLRGGALVIDAACASFLVAVHEARRKLACEEHELVLVGGYQMLCGPPPRRAADAGDLGLLSPTGRCRPFDERADGTTFGEGGGFVLLKRYADAIRDGDVVHAVITGSAVRHDGGRRSGLTTPSPAGQAQVISAALADSGADPASIGYVEAHGTGTRIGDPIEVQGLTSVFADAARQTGCPLTVSSVKGHLGYLEGMAGFAGLVRVIAQFRTHEIFPTAQFRAPNPLLGLDPATLRIADRRRPWPDRSGQSRRAGISAFGISGTNAHLIVEEPLTAEPLTAERLTAERLIVEEAVTAERHTAERHTDEGPLAAAGSPLTGEPRLAHEPRRTRTGEDGRGPARTDPGDHLVPLSAASSDTLRTLAARLRAVIAADPAGFPLADAADVLALGRDHQAFRMAWVVDDTTQLLAELTTLALPDHTGRLPAPPTATGALPPPLVLTMGDTAEPEPGLPLSPALARLRTDAARYPGCARVLAEAERLLPATRWSPAQHHVVRLVAHHAVLAGFGAVPELVLAHGAGARAARVVRGQTDLATALTATDSPSHRPAEPPNATALRKVVARLHPRTTVIDLTPGTALSNALNTHLPADRAARPCASLPLALCLLYRRGFDLKWRSGLGRAPHRRIELPVTPFDETHCRPAPQAHRGGQPGPPCQPGQPGQPGQGGLPIR